MIRDDNSVEYHHLHYAEHERGPDSLSYGGLYKCDGAPSYTRAQAEKIIADLQFIPTDEWGISALIDGICYGRIDVPVRSMPS